MEIVYLEHIINMLMVYLEHVFNMVIINLKHEFNITMVYLEHVFKVVCNSLPGEKVSDVWKKGRMSSYNSNITRVPFISTSCIC